MTSKLAIFVITDVGNLADINEATFGPSVVRTAPQTQALQTEQLFGLNPGNIFGSLGALQELWALAQTLSNTDVSDPDSVENTIKAMIEFGSKWAEKTGTNLDDAVFSFLMRLPEQYVGLFARLVSELATSGTNQTDLREMEQAFTAANIPWGLVFTVAQAIVKWLS